jgi:TRAP-type mannitol/chloroaromatic compound transport system permease large subunit|tara:strand:+ start:4332 stop:4508 length:177 start_codon:yes stop_codon:yes gene_type:complete
MEYTGVNLFVQQLVQMFIENKVLAAVTWIIFMGFVLRKLAKKDNDLYSKSSFFKKNKK